MKDIIQRRTRNEFSKIIRNRKKKISETLLDDSLNNVPSELNRNRVIISKDRSVLLPMTNEEDTRRKDEPSRFTFHDRRVRILDTENTMWSDPSKAVVPFAIQISEGRRRGRRTRTRMPPQRGERGRRGITTRRRFLLFDNRPSTEPLLFFVSSPFSFPDTHSSLT